MNRAYIMFLRDSDVFYSGGCWCVLLRFFFQEELAYSPERSAVSWQLPAVSTFRIHLSFQAKTMIFLGSPQPITGWGYSSLAISAQHGTPLMGTHCSGAPDSLLWVVDLYYRLKAFNGQFSFFCFLSFTDVTSILPAPHELLALQSKLYLNVFFPWTQLTVIPLKCVGPSTVLLIHAGNTNVT